MSRDLAVTETVQGRDMHVTLSACSSLARPCTRPAPNERHNLSTPARMGFLASEPAAQEAPALTTCSHGPRTSSRASSSDRGFIAVSLSSALSAWALELDRPTTLMTKVTLLADAAALAAACVILVSWARRRRSTIPGPPGLLVVGNALQIRNERQWLQFAEWSRDYGAHASLFLSLRFGLCRECRRCIRAERLGPALRRDQLRGGGF
jgi:hypothetical protein